MGKPVMTTASGVVIDFEKPEQLEVREEDIFYSHCNICRYNGARKVMLIEHDALITLLGNATEHSPRLKGLFALHDFAEYVVGDIVTGLKVLLPTYKEIERGFELVIWKHFGYAPPTEEEEALIRHYDLRALATETFMTSHPVADLVAAEVGSVTDAEIAAYRELKALSHYQMWEVTMRAVRAGACS